MQARQQHHTHRNHTGTCSKALLEAYKKKRINKVIPGNSAMKLQLFSTPRKPNVDLNDNSLELLIRPAVKEELYISGPRLVIKGIENEDLTSTIVEQFPEGLLAFDELCTSSSILHFNWLRTSTQKPYSYPLLRN